MTYARSTVARFCSFLLFAGTALLFAGAPVSLAGQDIPEMSPTAVAAFAEGMAAYAVGQNSAAAEHFARARTLDPSFAVAAFFEGVTLQNAGNIEGARAAYDLAWEGRHRMSPYYRNRLDAQMAGSTEASYASNLEAARVAAGTKAFYNAGREAVLLRFHYEGVDLLERIDRDGPVMTEYRNPWSWLNNAYHAMRRYEDELETAREGRRRHPDFQALYYDEGEALIAMGRASELDAVIDAFAELGSPMPPLLVTLAIEADAHAQPEVRDRLLDRAMQEFETMPAEAASENAPVYWRALAHYTGGDWDEAHQRFRELSSRDPDNNNWRAMAGAAAAQRGDEDEANREIRRLLDPATPGNSAQRALFAAGVAAELDEPARFEEYLGLALHQGLLFSIWDHRHPVYRNVRDNVAYLAFIGPEG
jgi:tetratricopeptide (TPR) repeat protein